MVRWLISRFFNIFALYNVKLYEKKVLFFHYSCIFSALC